MTDNAAGCWQSCLNECCTLLRPAVLPGGAVRNQCKDVAANAANKGFMNQCPTLLLPAGLHGGGARQPVSLQQFAEGRTGFGDYLRQWRGPPEGLTGPQKTASRCNHFICAPHGKHNCQDCNIDIVCVSKGIVCLAFCMTVACTDRTACCNESGTRQADVRHLPCQATKACRCFACPHRLLRKAQGGAALLAYCLQEACSQH